MGGWEGAGMDGMDGGGRFKVGVGTEGKCELALVRKGEGNGKGDGVACVKGLAQDETQCRCF